MNVISISITGSSWRKRERESGTINNNQACSMLADNTLSVEWSGVFLHQWNCKLENDLDIQYLHITYLKRNHIKKIGCSNRIAR